MPAQKGTLHYFESALAAIIVTLAVTSCSFQKLSVPAANAQVTAPVEPVITAPTLEDNEEEYLPEEAYSKALKLKKEGREPEAVLALRELAENSPETVWGARASFLLGLSALDSADPEALTLIKNAGDLTDIQDYLFYYEAEALRDQKDYNGAIRLYDLIISLFPDSALKPDAMYQRANTLMQAGDFQAARKGFTDFLKDYPKDSLVPDSVLRAAFLSSELNDKSEALKNIKRILIRFPAHSVARDANSLYAELKDKMGDTADFTLEERFQRGGRLLENARFKDAINEFSVITKDQKNEFYERSLLKLATAEMRIKRYEQAEKALKEYLSKKNPKQEREALLKLALTAVRQGKEGLLLETERKIANKYPKSVEHAQTLLFIGRHYEGRGDQEKALYAYREVSEQFKGSPEANDAQWAIGWLYYRAGRYKDAHKGFSAYGEKGKDAAQFMYWSGKSAEKSGNTGEAASIYEKVCGLYGDTYYCRMAEARRAALNAAPEVKKAESTDELLPEPAVAENLQENTTGDKDKNDTAPEDEPAETVDEEKHMVADEKALFLDPHYLAARELLILGLTQKAAGELETLTSRYSADRDSIAELASLFYKADEYQRALKIYRSYLMYQKNRSDYAELGFPTRLVDMIKKKNPTEGADPCLVAAVMREESAFNPKAISPTGALGLMQIMPSTGRIAAKGIGKEDFESRELFNPETNMKLGSWYLGLLSKRFNNDVILMIAGYNAGPNAVERWIETLPSSPDEFIESIPYSETRAYTKRVLKSYGEFLRLSGAEPDGKLTRPSIKRAPKGEQAKERKEQKES